MKLPDPILRFAASMRGDRKVVIPGERGTDTPNFKSTGGSTTSSGWDHLVTDREVNPDLAGRLRYANLDEMLMSDPVVAGSMLSIKLPMAEATAKVEPAGEGKDPTDRLVAGVVTRQLGLGDDEASPWLHGGWDSLLWLSGLHLDYGSMTGEIVWRDKPVRYADAQGDEHALLVVERVAPRYPHTLDDYIGGTDPGQPLLSVRQDGIKAPLPGAKLVHLVHAPHLSRFMGSSIMRPAYGIWKLKRRMIVNAAVGYDRHAAGTPIVRSPGSGSDEEERQARGMGRRYRNHEQAYFWLPGAKPAPGTPGWDVEVLNGAGTLADPIPQLRFYDEQIVSAVLGRFFMLGSTDTGSRAVGEVLSEPFYQALNWHADRLARDLTQQLVAKVVLANFGPDVDVPRIRFETIQQKNLPLRGDFIAKAQLAGVEFGDREAQDTIRGWVDIPKLPASWPIVPAANAEGQGPTGPLHVPSGGPEGGAATVPPAPSKDDPLGIHSPAPPPR